MGNIDIVTKHYLEDSRIFADAFNYFIYDGKPVIQPEQLRPLDAVATATPDGETPVQKTRDLLKCLVAMEDDNRAYAILGLENQSDVHYAMPVRNLLYDALTYQKQVRDIADKHRADRDSATGAEFLSGFHKEDKLTPVITLVIYFGANYWDGPTSLHEMMKLEETDEALKSMIDDYKIKLITPAQIKAEDFEKFHTNLRQVMEFIKYSKDKENMAQLMRSDAYRSIDAAAVNVIEHCTHLKLKPYIKNEKGDVDMCEAWDEMKKDCKAEGMQAGLQEGLQKKAAEIAKSMLQENNISHETIAKCSGLPLDTVLALAQEMRSA